jgi:hypothetical protein
MTRDEFNASIRASHSFCSSIELLENSIYLTSLPRSAEFNKLSLTSLNYNSIFESGLSLSHFNFLFKDLAYFQFSHDSNQEWALAYYPNPRISGCPEALLEYQEMRDAVEAGELGEDDFSALASGLQIGNYIPRIRFEYSERQYRPVRHPGAHFHIGMSGEDRWCSSRKLSPLTFVLLIVKQYYPDAWWARSRFALEEADQVVPANVSGCLDERLLRSIQSDGVSHILTEFETLTFHFAAVRAVVPAK